MTSQACLDSIFLVRKSFNCDWRKYENGYFSGTMHFFNLSDLTLLSRVMGASYKIEDCNAEGLDHYQTVANQLYDKFLNFLVKILRKTSYPMVKPEDFRNDHLT